MVEFSISLSAFNGGSGSHEFILEEMLDDFPTLDFVVKVLLKRKWLDRRKLSRNYDC